MSSAKYSFERDFLKLDGDQSLFAIPNNDEQVYMMREKQKQNQEKLRRINSAKPIWQKKTATSSMPLQRVRDHDIEPTLTNMDEPTILHNAEERKLIAEAKSITRARSARRVQSATQRTDYTSATKSQGSLPPINNRTSQKP